jgi:hypothetical protein
VLYVPCGTPGTPRQFHNVTAISLPCTGGIPAAPPKPKDDGR